MQLTDEPEKRCYPLNNRLFCYTCAKRTKTSPHPYSPNTIRASPAYYADRERPSTVSKVEFILLTCLKKSLLPILLRVLNFPHILPFGLATIAADESKQKRQ